jgi:hypothetical protein
VPAIVAVLALAGCSGGGDGSGAAPADAAHPTPVSAADSDAAGEGASPAADQQAEAAPAAGIASPVRDGESRDIDQLAATLAEGVDGDQEWVAVLARLQALDWLAARYPGEYDLYEIFSEEWAAEDAAPSQQQRLDLGVYLDQPLPKLVSVLKTGELGSLVELEALIETGEARIREVAGDDVVATLPAGTVRGLFIVSPDGPAGQWRIHSIAELALPEEQTP